MIYPVPRALDGPRFTPPTLVAGRLARIDALGVRFRGLEARLGELSPTPTGEAWVLVDGEDPTNMGWVLGLETLLLAFAAFNLVSLVRIARPVA